MLLQKWKSASSREVNTKFLLYQLEDSANKLLSPWKLPSLCFACLSHFGIFIIIINVCFIKIRSKLSIVLLLCLLRIFMKQTLLKTIRVKGASV